MKYRNDSKLSDSQVWANSVDPDQTAPEKSDQVQCLPSASFGPITL